MGRIFTKHIVYPLFWASKRLPVRRLIPAYFAHERLSSQELEDLQWRNLTSLLHHAYTNVPFYRDRMNAIGCHPKDIQTLDDFAKLPCLTKDDIIHHANDLVATNYSGRKLVRDSTGGSTGKNIWFYEDTNELGHRFAATVRGDAWAGLQLGSRYAQIWGSPLDIGKTSLFRRSIDKPLLRRLFISSFQLADEALEKAARQIHQFNPTVLIGYPTPLYRLAQYLAQHGMAKLGVSAIISSSETLYDYQRQEIEKQLGCKIFNRYGCREFGPIAVECEAHQGLHILADRLIVEFVEIAGCGAPNGLREMVITDLHKYAMPFIRYRIGDTGVPSIKRVCPCGRGFPLLERVEGRTFDLIIGTNGTIIAGTFWTLLFRSIEGIQAFQVIQRKRNTLEINLVVEESFNKSRLAELEQKIKMKCGNEMDIRFALVSQIEPGAGGKYRFIISEVAKEAFDI